MDESVKVSEESAVTIPLKNLISILTATAVAEIGYYQMMCSLGFVHLHN